MAKILGILRQFFKWQSEQEYAIEYLSQSYDHADLERRIKELDKRGIRYH